MKPQTKLNTHKESLEFLEINLSLDIFTTLLQNVSFFFQMSCMGYIGHNNDGKHLKMTFLGLIIFFVHHKNQVIHDNITP